MKKPIVSTWVFRLEIASDKTVWTKDIKAELTKLLFEAKLFGNFYVEEDVSGTAFHLLSIAKASPKTFRMLDCFCGMGGVSNGFSEEGFDVTGIDIVDAPKMLGYKHKFIQADMMTLKGEDFKGFDVIWGSPPCRDFTPFGRVYGKRWKNPPNPEHGKRLLDCFISFIEGAQPEFWLMENVFEASKYFWLKPLIIKYLGHKKQAFWGNIPYGLLPSIAREAITEHRESKGFKWPRPLAKNHLKTESWIHAKIPLACSRAFAVACREALEEKLEAEQ